MRILQIVPHYIPAFRYGGPLKVAHALGKALVKNGHDVIVYTTNMACEDSNLDMPIDVPVKIDGVNIYYEPVLFLRYWGFSPALYKRLKKETPSADLVIVHAHYQFANWIGAYMARKRSH